MDLNDAAVFAKVVQVGSFTGAAKLLNLPKSTVSAKVAALERHLGVALLQRTTRKLNVTQEGRTFFESCSKALSAFEIAESSVLSGKSEPKGLIRVTCPLDLGNMFMPEFLKDFLTKYPKLVVELILTGRVIDLIAEGVDIAIRASALRDSTMIAKKVGTSYFALFASPDYLKKAGRPQKPSDLDNHKTIRHSRTQPGPWHLQSGSARYVININPSVISDELSAVKAMAVAGHGIGLMPAFIAQEQLDKGELEKVLPQWAAYHDKLYIVYPGQKFQHPRVKLFAQQVALALEKFVEGN